MAYTPYDYTPADPANETYATIVTTIESNLLALVHALVIDGDVLGWNWQNQDTGGTYPPTTPATPGQTIWTNANNTQQKIKCVYTWTGSKLSSLLASYSSNGGTSYDPIASTAAPLGKLTLTYSAVPGYEGLCIATDWS